MDMYRYRMRLGQESAMESMKAGTKLIVNQTFHESPTFRTVYLNGIEYDARVSVDNKETVKEILFRPDTVIDKGDVINFDGTHWLVNNTYDNDIYPTCSVELCNEWLRWIDDNNNSFAYPCVVSGKSYDLDDLKEGKYIIYSETTVEIYCQYNTDTKTIKPQTRFIFNGKPYQIDGVDAVSDVAFGKGLIRLKATETLVETDDNIPENIADNRDEGWGNW
jgi:hypothetical protein